MDELAITMAKLTKCRDELFMEDTRTNVQVQPMPLVSRKEEITPEATSYTQTKLEIHQYLQDEGMSI